MTYRAFNLSGMAGFQLNSFSTFVDNIGTVAGYGESTTFNFSAFFGDNISLASLPLYAGTQTDISIYCGNKDSSAYGGGVTYFSSTFGTYVTDPFIYVNGAFRNVRRAGPGLNSQFVSAISYNGINYAVNTGTPTVPVIVPTSIFNTAAYKTVAVYGEIALTPLGGDNKLYVSCVDDAGNAYGTSSFNALANLTHACAWVGNTPNGTLYSPFGTDTNAFITCCSYDGSVLGGASYNYGVGIYNYRAVIWTAGKVLDIGLPPGFTDAIITGMSYNGTFLCGQVSNGINSRAFVYTVSKGFTILPLPADGTNQAVALSISDDGVFVSGYGPTALVSATPFMWIGEKLNQVYQLQIPEPITMPCITPCLGVGSIITKV